MQEIVQWSQGLCLWQRDALRRLCVLDVLTESDLAECATFCRQQHEPKESVPADARKPEPLAGGHVRADGGGDNVALKSVKDVANVNALADGQTLKFRDTGLTAVFGGNGSGKSGYARVLKKACRARVANVTILPNVYLPKPKTPATAAVEYSVGGKAASAKWTDGVAADDALSSISVFDSACAVAHVEKTNDVAYTPAALEVLARLAETCREVKRRLGVEQQAIQATIPPAFASPKCGAQTKVGKLIAGISAASTIATFESLAVLSEAEQKRLETLRSDLASDPRKAADQLRPRKQRLTQTISKAVASNAAVAEVAAEQFKQQLSDEATKTEAARLAANVLFKDQPLPNIGSETWRALWTAARKYSETEAYSGQSFPVAADGSRCVLCLQELDEEARGRFSQFETFVKENAQQAAQDAKRAVERTRSVVRAANFTAKEQTDALGQVRDELESPTMADELRRFLTIARWRRRLLLKATAADWPVLPQLPDAAIASLRTLETQVGNRITDLQNAANAAARQLLQQECQELEDRIWLSSVLDDVRKEIERRKKLSVLAAAINDTDTRAITTKSTALAEKLVTNALRDRFSQELDRLGLTKLRIELVQAGSQYGVPKFKLSLIASPSAEVGLVLSEGEYRCIALAAFLSELATADGKSGIVFDDPVSSLDHDYRQAVAKRLVEESQNRQIIVFTHDIVFLTQLAEQARQLNADIAYQCVGRGADRTGFCNSEPPMRVRPVLDAVAGLEKHLGNVTYAFNNGDMPKWWREAKGIAGDLRDLWERAVEQALSPVYSRFDYGVDTKNLIKVTILTDNDCKVMRAAFGRCSTLQHSEPSAAGTPPPKPQDLQNEIDELRAWMTSVLDRQKAVS